MSRYFIFHKPFQVLSQFSPEGDKKTLATFGFPKNIYPIGRLDFDSEGLLLLSDDKKLNHRLLDPKFEHKRTYWAQVEGDPKTEDLSAFEHGIEINLKGKLHTCKKAEAFLLKKVLISERNPPIRYRASIPDAWIALSLTEGKNRQVRKMCAAIGYPVLRLIRIEIENVRLDGLIPGEHREVKKDELYKLLNISPLE